MSAVILPMETEDVKLVEIEISKDAGLLCAWCGMVIELEAGANDGGLCPACEERIRTGDLAWIDKEEL